MTAKILLFAFGVVALSSCSTYKSGQTPDDVYYSPAKEVTAYVRVDNTDDRKSGNRSYNEYNEDYRNDRFMRLSMYNQSRWGAFDDYYWNNNLMYNNYYGYNSWTNPWNSYYYWNSFYNPYCSPGYIITNPYKGSGMVYPTSRATAYNYNAYVNRNYNNNNLYFNNGGNSTNRISSRYNNRYVTGNGNSTESNSLRRMFNSSNASGSGYYDTHNYNNSRSSNSNYNSNNNSYSQPSSRSYTPSSSSSSGGGVSSGGSSSGGSISRPGRN